MAISFDELEGRILRVLQKDAGARGFYTQDKVRDAINDCFDYVSARMFRGVSGGWRDTIRYFDTTSDQSIVPLSEDIGVIKEVRYKVGLSYVPLVYDTGHSATQWAGQSGVTQFPSRYRILQNNIYFNPPLGVAGPQYLQVECSTYPAPLCSGESIPTEFDNAMLNYIKWRSASQLASSIGKGMKEWEKFEQEWQFEVEQIIDQRVRGPIFIKEFDG